MAPTPPSDRGALLRALASDPRYAGTWAEGDSILHVAATGDVGDVEDSVRHLVPAGLELTFHVVKYTLAELEAVRTAVLEGQADVPGRPRITFADADERRNRVVVGIQPFSEEAADHWEGLYADAIEVIYREVPQQRP